MIFTDELPKTRSGKIMRRLLRDVAEGRELGDTTTLADPARRRGDPQPGARPRPRRTDLGGVPTEPSVDPAAALRSPFARRR